MTNPFDPDRLEKAGKGRKLNLSRPYSYTLWSEAGEVDALVARLHDEVLPLLKLKRVNRSKNLTNLKVLVLNLYIAFNVHPVWYVGYQRSKRGYLKQGRYNPAGVSAITINLVDAMLELGYVEGVLGYRNPKQPEYSRTSRLRATAKLRDLFMQVYCLDPAMVTRHPDSEIILLRESKVDGKGKLLDYEDTAVTLGMRKNLIRINDLLQSSEITLHLSDEEMGRLNARLIEDDDPHKRSEPLDMSRVRLHRTFNDASFERGGRFYGGWWQNVYREYRTYIGINGSPIVELDYSFLHPRILYAMERVEPPEDAYTIEGIPSECRKLVKTALLRMINAEDYEAARQSLLTDCRTELGSLEGGVNYLMAQIESSHKPISKHFYSGIGTSLQYHDSQIAEEVMLYFVEQGVPLLPLHDSFCVPARWALKLKKVMEECFQRRFKAKGIATPKEGFLVYGDLDLLKLPLP